MRHVHMQTTLLGEQVFLPLWQRSIYFEVLVESMPRNQFHMSVCPCCLKKFLLSNIALCQMEKKYQSTVLVLT